MRKIISFAGPAAALIAMKCPLCLLALAGLGAGVGSLIPVVQGTYWLVLIGLAGVFLWHLIRQWKSRQIHSWVIGFGLIGIASLIYQTISEPEGWVTYVPAITLTIAAVATPLGRTPGDRAACSNCEAPTAKNGLEPSPKDKPDTSIKEEENMAKRKIEVFTSGCPVCEPVVDLVKKTACPSCDVVVYDLNAGCATNECRDKAKQYGITRVPAVVVNGKLLDCCKTGSVSEQVLRAAGVGSS